MHGHETIDTGSVRQKLQARAGREVAQSNNDVLAFADRNREIIQLPEGLETGETMRRKRGARTDDDVIEEVIEIFAQGITITASLQCRTAIRDVAQVGEEDPLSCRRASRARSPLSPRSDRGQNAAHVRVVRSSTRRSEEEIRG